MESRKEVKLDLIAIDNTEHTRYIVAVHSLFSLDTIMAIHEEDCEPGFPREDEQADLDAT